MQKKQLTKCSTLSGSILFAVQGGGGAYLNIIKAIYEKPTPDAILKGKN